MEGQDAGPLPGELQAGGAEDAGGGAPPPLPGGEEGEGEVEGERLHRGLQVLQPHPHLLMGIIYYLDMIFP